MTLEAIARIRDEFGVNMTCGASNVSFGMPDRHALGAAFLPMAMTHGLTSAIMDARTPQIVEAVRPPTCCSATTRGARLDRRAPRASRPRTQAAERRPA